MLGVILLPVIITGYLYVSTIMTTGWEAYSLECKRAAQTHLKYN